MNSKERPAAIDGNPHVKCRAEDLINFAYLKMKQCEEKELYLRKNRSADMSSFLGIFDESNKKNSYKHLHENMVKLLEEYVSEHGI